MKRIICMAVLALATALQLPAQTLPLSGHARASVITCGAGNDFYTTFGHSAIRITDTSLGLDMVYNYGTFDFDTPHFYWKFAQGRLDYCLSRTEFGRFMYVYAGEQRAVWEQPLNMSEQEVNNLYVLLEQNYLPEYRYYRYDFFRDNCATRVRDMVEAALGHDGADLSGSEEGQMTYRQYLHRAMRDTLEWWAVGIDILLGLPADHRCTAAEAMFHPLVMMEEYALAERKESRQPVVNGSIRHLQDMRPPLKRSFPPLAAFALALAAVAALTVWGRRRGWRLAWLDRTLYIVAGLIGLFLLFMWFGTDHYCTKWNYNLLWASPLLLLIAIRLERSPRWALWLQTGMLVAYMIIAGVNHTFALLPIALLLLIRLWAGRSEGKNKSRKA